MSTEIRKRLESVSALLDNIREACRYEEEKVRLEELEQEMSTPGFHDDQENRDRVIGEYTRVRSTVTAIGELEQQLEDTQELLTLGEEEKDAATIEESDGESRKLLRAAEKLELRALLSGKYDGGSAFISIQSGAGGTDACDWVTMLKRMYLRWSDQMGFKSEVLDEVPGEEAGLKSFSAHIVGPYSYGYLRAEHGVHRLVRISPFDAQGRRQTSFAGLDVSPEVEGNVIEIEESDLRIDTYRASGAGGQHVNTTDSAVRITHIPTGVVVQCQNQRSQHANRTQALKVLQSRLAQLEEKRLEEEISKETGAKGEISFSSQIRSYVLHPNKFVKDHRTSHETGNAEAVLDGELQPFIEAELRRRAQASGQKS